MNVFGIFIGLTLFAGLLYFIMSYIQCQKSDDFFGVTKAAAWWALFPTLTYALLGYSTYLRTEFASGMQWFASKIGSTPDQASLEFNGTIYAMGLVALIMSSSMMNQLDSVVCKPTVDELASFQEDLMKELKAKEADRKRDEAVNKTTA